MCQHYMTVFKGLRGIPGMPIWFGSDSLYLSDDMIKLDMTRQCALATQEAKWILGCIQSSMASRSREGILPLHSALEYSLPQLECCIRIWGPQHRKVVVTGLFTYWEVVEVAFYDQDLSRQQECMEFSTYVCGWGISKLTLASRFAQVEFGAVVNI
ncbi:hypothetical protein WISP_14917 [Willisornis vidua]|uniref:Uncharacterized protein n=1 Tax=Willisornis vidua TaxID=1566151 RepID=A0ABQ9DW29_9PASS|nr:hypothetical protein WISP_14917 [Willisornis vidua]